MYFLADLHNCCRTVRPRMTEFYVVTQVGREKDISRGSATPHTKGAGPQHPPPPKKKKIRTSNMHTHTQHEKQ